MFLKVPLFHGNFHRISHEITKNIPMSMIFQLRFPVLPPKNIPFGHDIRKAESLLQRVGLAAASSRLEIVSGDDNRGDVDVTGWAKAVTETMGKDREILVICTGKWWKMIGFSDDHGIYRWILWLSGVSNGGFIGLIGDSRDRGHWLKHRIGRCGALPFSNQ